MEGAKQPYHFAESLGLEEAERHLQKCAAVSQRLAVQAMREMLDGVTARKYRVLGCAILLASGRALPSLQKILASHALIHAAEGEFFRKVVADACEACHVPVMRFRERELNGRANTTFGNCAPSVRQHISELGKTVGSVDTGREDRCPRGIDRIRNQWRTFYATVEARSAGCFAGASVISVTPMMTSTAEPISSLRAIRLLSAGNDMTAA